MSMELLSHKELVGLKRNQSSKELLLNSSGDEEDQQLPLKKRQKYFSLTESLELRQEHFA